MTRKEENKESTVQVTASASGCGGAFLMPISYIYDPLQTVDTGILLLGMGDSRQYNSKRLSNRSYF